MTSDVQFQNLLSAVTDALLADQAHEVEAIIQQYAVPHAEVESLVNLIRRLHLTLVGAQPSRRYVHRLKHDLIGAERPGVVWRLRHLPLRVQIAAAIALLAGFMLLTRRRMAEDVRQEQQEVAVL